MVRYRCVNCEESLLYRSYRKFLRHILNVHGADGRAVVVAETELQKLRDAVKLNRKGKR